MLAIVAGAPGSGVRAAAATVKAKRFSMAKGRKDKSDGSEPKAPSAAPKKSAAPEKATTKAGRELRKLLQRLEVKLADAAKAEAKRVRRLEEARWRRQRLEFSVDEARTAAAVEPGAAAVKPVKTKAPRKTKPAPEKKTRAKAKAAPEPKKKAAEPKTKAARKPKTKADAPPAEAADVAPTAPASEVAPAAPDAPAIEAAPAAPEGSAVIEAYCLREKRRVQMLDPKPVVTANGGSALSGTCPSCGASLYKLVGRTAH
jgi:hypothetical protein